jgi:hypothetical protein
MTYKAFQDWYREGNIKHLLLHEHNGYLISPPFATERCKDYNKIMKYDGTVSYIDTKLPDAVSKTNAVVEVNGNSWFLPYGIYEDDYNTVLKLNKDTPEYEYIKAKGKGQFYSGASNGETAFSFPLGYSGTQYCLYIKDNFPTLIPFNSVEKAHMGTVYCNGSYYSMPRGDLPGYNDLVSFDGKDFHHYHVPVNPEITRKYTDLIVVGDKLYSLPFGETPGLNEVVEFDTVTKEFTLHKLDIPDFAKKYNSMVIVGNSIIGMPYGDEYCNDSNYGVVFDIVTKKSKMFDIGIKHGGKYRYRTGIEYKNFAWFFPGGSPQCPIYVINERGLAYRVFHYENQMFGRPVIYKDKIHVIAYDVVKETHSLYIFNDRFESEVIDL